VKVLFITSTRIGDAVLSTGLLSKLIDSHPTIDITIACGPAAAPIFAETPNLKTVFTMKKRAASLHWLDLWKKCVSIRWDIIVDLRNSPVSRVLFAKSRYFMKRNDPSQHRVQQLGAVMGLFPPPSPQLWISGEHEKTAKKLLPERDRALALGPMANWPGKEWQLKNFSEIACRLTGNGGILAGAPVLILGSNAERQRAEKVAADISWPKCINLAGKLDLLTAYAVLRRSALFIGNDSGLMHIAAASGVPTLGLFGPSREEHYGPWGEKTASVRTCKTYDELVRRPGYDHRNTGSLMSSLSTRQVEEAAVSLWSRVGGAG